jgi:hypothetical protein
MPSLKYLEVFYKRTQLTNDLQLPDGEYNGFCDDRKAIIRIKDNQAVAISYMGGYCHTTGILKSSMELLIEVEKKK